MAEPKSEEEEKQIDSQPDPEEIPEIGDDELDLVIAEEDPEFVKSISEVENDKDLSMSQIVISDEEQALNEEKDLWLKGPQWKKVAVTILPFIPYFSLKFKKLKFIAQSFWIAKWVQVKNYLYFLATTGKNKLVEKIKELVRNFFGNLGQSKKTFFALKWNLKIAGIGLIFLVGATIFIIYLSLTRGLVPTQNEIFIPSMERVATDIQIYDPASEVEPFYENLRATQNLLLIPKMVVNLRQSSQSGPNPMGAFELFLEGMAPEVIIEAKDREVEIRDLILRVLEEFTFDQLDNADGKKEACDKIKREVNSVLTTGKLKRVWIKTAILKP